MPASSLLLALPFGFMALDTLRFEVGVEDFHRAGIKGKGVIVGLAEAVDFSLWDFRNPDGTTRFLRYFDRTRPQIDSLLRARFPENRIYPYFDPEDSLRFHSSQSDHGTSVLSIAAGNGQSKGAVDLRGKYLGLAPEADLVAGDYFKMRELAESLGRPLVFNHSFQNNLHLPPGEPTIGRIAVIATGNSHALVGRHRFIPGDTQGVTFHFRPVNRAFHRVDDSSYLFDVLLRLWYPDTADPRLDITLRSPNDTTLRYRVDLKVETTIDDTLRGPEPNQYGACTGVPVPLHEAVHIGNQPNFRWVDLRGNYGLRYRVRTRAFKDFSISFNRVAFQGSEELLVPSEVISGVCERHIQAEEFRDDLKGTMGVMAGFQPTSVQLPDLQAIHVGAYARQVDHAYPNFDPLFQRAGAVAFYSGRGDFARFGVVKPEVAAPSHKIMALGYFTPSEWTSPATDSLHSSFDGTSAAAPVVTGAVALLLQMDPALDDVRVKEILRENARTDAFTGAVPNDDFGYGKFHLDWDKVRARLGYVGLPRAKPSMAFKGPLANPFRDRFRFEFSSSVADPTARLEVLDLRGRVVFRSTPGVQPGLTTWDIDATTWPGGVYAYRLMARSGARQGKAFRLP